MCVLKLWFLLGVLELEAPRRARTDRLQLKSRETLAGVEMTSKNNARRTCRGRIRKPFLQNVLEQETAVLVGGSASDVQLLTSWLSD